MLNTFFLSSKRLAANPPLFLRDQTELVSDYWSKHTFEEGALASLYAATELVQDSVQGTHFLLEVTAGAGMGVVNLLGGIPIGLYSWSKQVVQEMPKGPGEVLYKFIEVPVKGFFDGAEHVYAQSLKGMDIALKIYRGDVYQVRPWEIAYGVTTTLGTAAMLILGAKHLASGSGKVGGSFSIDFSPAMAMEVATAVPSIVVNLAKFGKGSGEVGVMAVANQKDGQEEPMVSLPGGRIVRGSKTKLGFGDVASMQEVQLLPFKISRAPVTNALWVRYASEYHEFPFAILGREMGTGIWKVLQRGKTEAELKNWIKSQVNTDNLFIRSDELLFEKDSLEIHRIIPEMVLRRPKGIFDGFDAWSQPVVLVNWAESVAAADGIGRILTGESGHLPTELQWEYAARGPLVNVTRQMKIEGVRSIYFEDFVQGPKIKGICSEGKFGRYENFVKIVDLDTMEFGTEIFTDPNHPTLQQMLREGQTIGASRVFATNVGSFEPTVASSVFTQMNNTRSVRESVAGPFGLKDMNGNVWEWSNDGAVGEMRVLRGGCWGLTDPRYLRTISRDHLSSSDHKLGVGLRVVVSTAP